ncbi:hypothetical protein L798_13550 [Zootermopsis nevadensis]|uniref:Uncharacterized protein n=1 Tax=Zootermopsis nevadensis TaxID=136037 RepID=A0A067QS56_ZOONE|nr:hypothetical protein L798_13550 [Zootermopsis nevadensis]
MLMLRPAFRSLEYPAPIDMPSMKLCRASPNIIMYATVALEVCRLRRVEPPLAGCALGLSTADGEVCLVESCTG